jgi:hypothetical protein
MLSLRVFLISLRRLTRTTADSLQCHSRPTPTACAERRALEQPRSPLSNTSRYMRRLPEQVCQQSRVPALFDGKATLVGQAFEANSSKARPLTSTSVIAPPSTVLRGNFVR